MRAASRRMDKSKEVMGNKSGDTIFALATAIKCILYCVVDSWQILIVARKLLPSSSYCPNKCPRSCY